MCGLLSFAFGKKKVHRCWRLSAEGESLEAGCRDFLSLSNSSIKGRRVGDKPWLQEGVLGSSRLCWKWLRSELRAAKLLYTRADASRHTCKDGMVGKNTKLKYLKLDFFFWLPSNVCADMSLSWV